MSYACIGIAYPVFALLDQHTDGSIPSYKNGKVIQEAREVNVTKTYSDNPLYGDDAIQDDENGLTALAYDFESTGITDEDRVLILGETANANTVTGGYWEGDNVTPWGGFGFIRRMRHGDGTKKYEAWIAVKIKFQETTQQTRTKEGQNISWGTPRLSGTAASLDVDGSGVNKFRLHETFTTMQAAKDWINNILNIAAVTT